MNVETSTDRISPADLLSELYAAEERYIAAGGAKAGADFSEMAACLHPEVVMHQGPSTPFPGDWVGISEVQRFFSVLAETWVGMEINDIEYYLAGEGIAVTMNGRLTSRATGRTLEAAKCAQVITMKDGLVHDWTVFYLDPVGVLTACGIEPDGPE